MCRRVQVGGVTVDQAVRPPARRRGVGVIVGGLGRVKLRAAVRRVVSPLPMNAAGSTARRRTRVASAGRTRLAAAAIRWAADRRATNVVEHRRCRDVEREPKMPCGRAARRCQRDQAAWRGRREGAGQFGQSAGAATRTSASSGAWAANSGNRCQPIPSTRMTATRSTCSATDSVNPRPSTAPASRAVRQRRAARRRSNPALDQTWPSVARDQTCASRWLVTRSWRSVPSASARICLGLSRHTADPSAPRPRRDSHVGHAL